MKHQAFALIREAKEEVGITVQPDDLKHVLTLHHACTDYKAGKEDVIEFYFQADLWSGMPEILEPEKASEIGFYPIASLPEPVPKGLVFALEAIKNQRSYQEN